MDPSDVAGDVAESAATAGSSFLDELKKIGKTALGQVIGKSDDQVPGDIPNEKDLATLKKKDEEFSANEVANLRAKIASMYQSYDVLRKKEEKLEEEQEKQEKEFEKLQEINELRQAGNAVNVNVATAVGKASAETGKHYGTE